MFEEPIEKLTFREERLVTEYLQNGNGAKSARIAGYSHKNARRIAERVLKKPHVKRRIERIMSDAAAKLGITVEFVLGNLKYFAEQRERGWATASIDSNKMLAKHLKIEGFGETDTTVNVNLSRHQEIINQLADDDAEEK